MSGSIGGNRIKRKNVENTLVKNYNSILSCFENFSKYCITGSYNAGKKEDHGDIDLCIFIDSKEDLKTIKKKFKEYLESKNDLQIVPFRSGKNKGKKAQLYGNIVTCQIPINGQEGEYVQVDNIIVNDENSLYFVKNFLDLDAQKQTLFTAIVRVIGNEIIENMYKDHFQGIQLKENQEFEFVLSMFSLSLRIVTLDDDKKEIERQDIWKTSDWNHVRHILSSILKIDNYHLYTLSFEELLEIVKYRFADNERARKRIYGIMKSMINIGPGEVGTEKGNNKQNAIDLTYEKLINI